MNDPKFPQIEVELVGNDGNAYAVMGAVGVAMLKGGLTKEDVKEYTESATSGDYDNLLMVTMETVTVL